jgi:hypothetical protein
VEEGRGVSSGEVGVGVGDGNGVDVGVGLGLMAKAVARARVAIVPWPLGTKASTFWGLILYQRFSNLQANRL